MPTLSKVLLDLFLTQQRLSGGNNSLPYLPQTAT